MLVYFSSLKLGLVAQTDLWYKSTCCIVSGKFCNKILSKSLRFNVRQELTLYVSNFTKFAERTEWKMHGKGLCASTILQLDKEDKAVAVQYMSVHWCSAV